MVIFNLGLAIIMQRLTLNHSFHLALTPSLKEAISLLQLSAIDLADKMKDFCEINPFFEINFQPKTTSFSTLTTPLEHTYADRNSLSLAFDLTQSLIHSKVSAQAFQAGLNLIQDMDERGFFLEEEFDRLPTTIQKELDKWLHTFIPIGVGARSQLQSLAWQLRYRADLSTISEAKSLLALIEQWSINGYNIEPDWISRLKEPAFAKILHLLYWNPADQWQGPSYGDKSSSEYVDLIVEMDGHDYKVFLNPELIPEITLHSWPESLSKKHPFRQHYQNAQIFKKMLHTRWSTLQRTAQYIVSYQKKFFQYGPTALRPLILAQIANDLSLHESTISRILHLKTICTPFGVMELKKLLSRPIKKAYGELGSHGAVLDLLANCIAHENPMEPYSDQALSDILHQQGYHVARRTIAKYREQLNIASSHHRRTHIGESHENRIPSKPAQ